MQAGENRSLKTSEILLKPLIPTLFFPVERERERGSSCFYTKVKSLHDTVYIFKTINYSAFICWVLGAHNTLKLQIQSAPLLPTYLWPKFRAWDWVPQRQGSQKAPRDRRALWRFREAVLKWEKNSSFCYLNWSKEACHGLLLFLSYLWASL